MDNTFGLLSTGGYANVYYHKERQLIKKVQPTIVELDDKSRILQYASIVDLASHASLDVLPGLPVMLDYAITPKSVKIYMPYYGKPLHKVVHEWRDAYHETRVLRVLTSLVETCMQLEHNGMQHTDIKPSNILVSDKLQVTLIDFNIMSSLRCRGDGLGWDPAIGTWNYCAPEIVEHSAPTTTSMVWSLGLLMAYMFSRTLFSERTDEEARTRELWVSVLQKEREANPEHLRIPSKHKLVMPPWLQYAFSRCMQWDPVERWSLFELRTMLYVYRTSAPAPCLYLHTISWLSDPRRLDFAERQQAIETIHELCVATHTEHVFVLIVSWMDRLPYMSIKMIDIAALFALANMLLGNFVFDDETLCAVIAIKLGLGLEDSESQVMEHVIAVGQALGWKLWEKTTDVYLAEMGKSTTWAIAYMKGLLLEIQHPYTMAELAASCI